MLIWLKDAPVFGVDEDDAITAFLDNIISGQKPSNNPQLHNLVNRQIHRHSHTCKKKAKKECRFNFPQPPMRSTKILYPLSGNMPSNEIKHHKESWKAINKHLNDLKEGKEITFDQLLIDLNITEKNYLLAVSSCLNAPTIFLKRGPSELRVNNYNTACLSAWRANMDIQFVLDVYACAYVYCILYFKSTKGMSELLRKTCDEAREKNSTIKQQVRDIGNKFLNSVEISAQEAVHIALQLPMRKSSHQVTFINTSPPEERGQLLKPMNEIEQLEGDSDDVHSGSLLKRYIKRPSSLEHVTLADWVAWYDSNRKPCVKKSPLVDTDGLPVESVNDDDHNDDDISNESSKQKRTKARIIRSVWFNKESHPEKHFRELIMLFTAWRNEEVDLIANASSFQERFLLLKGAIDDQMSQYAVCSEEISQIQDQLDMLNEDELELGQVAPNTQHTEIQDEAEGALDLHIDFNEQYDLSNDVGIPSTSATCEPLILNEIADEDYREMVQMLNKEQKEFYYHILHLKNLRQTILLFP